ncbi:hypothetical protein [Actinomadura kijaniata]|uniref:hypothetical protein n=1 Tax=Actinomadura kijaniata TaxID=46161 RepID=UPI000A997EA2|nr:hypothetical protein [Actinomadura kijaniata]
MSLTDLGLTAEQERVYRLLLRDPRATVRPDAWPVVVELRTLGLVDEGLAPVPPAAAVDLLVRRRVERAQRQLGGLALAWTVLTELAEEQRSGRPVQLVEHLPDAPAVVRRVRALLDDEPGELLRLRTRVVGEDGTLADEGIRALLARGLRSRTLCPAHVLDDPAEARRGLRRHALGDLHRVTFEPVRQVAVVNRTVMLVQADPCRPAAGAVQVRQPGIAALLVEVFEGMWERGRDLEDLPLSPAERRVLHALVHHDTDEAAARSAAMSVRKFRAHVADLRTRLGARTRFQIALLARERGWL